MTPYLPALTRLLDILYRSLHGRENIAEKTDNAAQLVRGKVRGLRALAGADTERDTIILVHGNRRVKHIHRAKRLSRTVKTVLRVAVKGFNERREIGNRDFLRARALAASKGELDHGNPAVIHTDFDAIASGGEGGGDGRVDEKLGHFFSEWFPVVECDRGEPFPTTLRR